MSPSPLSSAGGTPAPPLDAEAPLFQLDHPDPSMPILLAGRMASAVLAGDGELALSWESRGALSEWGGAYAQGVRLTGPWRLSLTPEGGRRQPLSEFLQDLTATRTSVRAHYRGAGWVARQDVVVPSDRPAVTRKLSLTSVAERPQTLRIETELSPFLLPVMMEGLRPETYTVESLPQGLRFTAHSYAAEIVSNVIPSTGGIDGGPIPALPDTRPIRSAILGWEVPLEPAESVDLDWVIWGGLGSTLAHIGGRGDALLGSSLTWRADRERDYRTWLEERPRLSFPQAPELERAYNLALGAFESLYFAPEPRMVGFAAGYPWYDALWCRDIAWMLPAALWLGDHGWALSTLDTVLRFQSGARIPLLGAGRGEIPMQISPGPLFLYGTSDTTLHYPAVVARTLRHVGGSALPVFEGMMPKLGLCLEWATTKVNPATGLFTNGGEVAEISAAQEGAGRVQYGSDAVDTTIWDSTDRRAHAIDCQVLWVRALEGMAELSSALGLQSAAPTLSAQAAHIRGRVLDLYWWEKETYLADTLTLQGQPVLRLRPNALMAVMDGWLTPDRARRVVARASQADLATAWGVRTLSSSDPAFDPQAYHDGQVWTIATAWAAHAALMARDFETGMRHLGTIAGILQRERGLANECYDGLRPVPYNSCFLLGFSVAPFLTALFEGLWGLKPDALHQELTVDPRFPPTWNGLRLENLSLGGSRLDLEASGGRLTATVTSGPPVSIATPAGRCVVAPGTSGTLPLSPP